MPVIKISLKYLHHDEFGLLDRSCSFPDIQDYFEHIIKKTSSCSK